MTGKRDGGRGWHLEVVDVEEDDNIWHHLDEPLLDHTHLVLSGGPRVREEEVVGVGSVESRRVHLRVIVVAPQAARACGARLHRTHTQSWTRDTVRRACSEVQWQVRWALHACEPAACPTSLARRSASRRVRMQRTKSMTMTTARTQR